MSACQALVAQAVIIAVIVIAALLFTVFRIVRATGGGSPPGARAIQPAGKRRAAATFVDEARRNLGEHCCL